MATEEDNFDIDLYGDSGGDGGQNEDSNGDEVDFTMDEENPEQKQEGVKSEPQPQAQANGSSEATQAISSTAQPSAPQVQVPKQPPQQQGVKRKDSSSDHRPLDPGASAALIVSDLQWWNTEDDLRGWANQADAEDELKDVTFSEHKVNGKSKGQAFMEFASPQAATATKRKIDSFASGQQNVRKYSVTFTNPTSNPYKTLPKDGPMRAKDAQNQRNTSGSYNSGTNSGNFGNHSGGYRGGRGGGFNNRGNMNNMGGGYNNRSFSGPMGGYPAVQGGGFQNNMGGMPNFGGFNNRGGMMNNMRGGGGMRGGHGGMSGGMMPMGNMGMAGMGMNMANNMNPMMGMGMQGGFQGGNANFNPGFFQNQGVNSMGSDGSWNPHGAKRTRQE